jgi:hypothetical protein
MSSQPDASATQRADRPLRDVTRRWARRPALTRRPRWSSPTADSIGIARSKAPPGCDPRLRRPGLVAAGAGPRCVPRQASVWIVNNVDCVLIANRLSGALQGSGVPSNHVPLDLSDLMFRRGTSYGT